MIDPLPDVKINGLDGPLTLGDTQGITLSARLLAGEVVGNVDYWLIAQTPVGTYFYDHATKGWGLNIVPAAQAPIEDRLVQVLTTTADILPVGTTIIWGGVDLTPNGVLDGPIYYDSLKVSR